MLVGQLRAVPRRFPEPSVNMNQSFTAVAPFDVDVHTSALGVVDRSAKVFGLSDAVFPRYSTICCDCTSTETFCVFESVELTGQHVRVVSPVRASVFVQSSVPAQTWRLPFVGMLETAS